MKVIVEIKLHFSCFVFQVLGKKSVRFEGELLVKMDLVYWLFV